MHSRFYAPGLAPGDARIQLPADESAHALRVLRLRQGAEVRVFNGRGVECRGVVEAVARDLVTVSLDGVVENAAEPRTPITLVQAVLKGDGMDEVVRDAVMLGVAAVVPVISERTETDLRRLAKGGRVERWRRVAVSSAKQCGRAVVPRIDDPLPLAGYLPAVDDALRVMLVEPSAGCGEAGAGRLASLPRPASIALLSGPEGGWTPAETRAGAAAGFRPLTLGPRILRANAAALAAIPVLQFICGDV